MKKWCSLLILPTLMLASCAPHPNGTGNNEAQTAGNQQHLEKQIIDGQQSATGQGGTQPAQEQPAANGEQATHGQQGKAQEVAAEKPSHVQTPQETKFEALVLASGGTKLYEEPNAQAKAVGNLVFGEHVFALLEVEQWIYVTGEKFEGWVKQDQIREIPYDSSKKIEVDNPADLLVLVNKTYRLPSEYKPDNLVIPDIPFPFEGTPEKKMMREEAAKALEELFAKCQEDGLELFGISGYRSFATQRNIFPSNVLRVGYDSANQFSAFPGESEHQTGLAMDVSNRQVNFRLVEAFGDTAEGLWLQENAHQFGFIIRYPKGKESMTGYTYEPWHLRYVGPEAAQKIHELNITFEEYLEKHAK